MCKRADHLDWIIDRRCFGSARHDSLNIIGTKVHPGPDEPCPLIVSDDAAPEDGERESQGRKLPQTKPQTKRDF